MGDVPAEFKRLLATEPFIRTAKGTRWAAGLATDLPEGHLALLRRFTGRTDFDLLLSADEAAATMMQIAWNLFERGLIEPCVPRPSHS